ncbi:MAG TPA: LPP20 family lipoprotein [Candidatus Sumerlaeota bacterium]|nr:LPP20 family lipoprotein [Candidatus Sumerlaeota bacterium]HOR64884.1 LPP20 family lipoprotein [Candidatus Sumerlaeota bacterium]
MKFFKAGLLVLGLVLMLSASGCHKAMPVHLMATGVGAAETAQTALMAPQAADMSWADEDIVAVGRGKPPAKAANASQARLMAKRAARLDAMRNLAEQAQLDTAGLPMKKDFYPADYEKSGEMIKRFEAFLVGAEVVAEKEFESGECEVKMRLNLRTLYKELPPNKAEVVRRRLMAERAAKQDAQRQLMEALKGAQISSTMTVEDFMVKSDRIRNRVEGIVRDARMVDRRFNSDGTVEVDLLLEHPDIREAVK